MGEIVCLPLGFIAIFGLGEGNGHYASVVDKAVEFLFFGNEFLCS